MAFQVYSRDYAGKVHEERYTTNEILAAELAKDLANDPDIQDAWYNIAGQGAHVKGE